MKYFVYLPDYDYYRFLFGHAKTRYDVEYIYDFNIRTSNPVLRFLFRLHYWGVLNSLFKLPGKRIWYKYFVPEIAEDEPVCFIFYSSRAGQYEPGFYEYLRRHYNCKLALLISNPVEFERGYYDLDFMKRTMDLVCTYNEHDVAKYGLALHPPLLFALENLPVKPMGERSIDVLFVGKDKGRRDYIEALEKKLVAFGLRCSFFIADGSRRVPYADLVRMTGDAKCLVNLLQVGSEGVTLRDIDAWNYGCFLMTNNRAPELREMLHEGQLIDIDRVDDAVCETIKARTEEFPPREAGSLDGFYAWVAESCK